MRRAANLDRNHADVVKALRAIGASVQSLASMGGGCPDLAVGYHGLNVFLEVKDGSKPPSARQLTQDEENWHAAWGGQVDVVNSPEEAQRVVIDHCVRPERERCANILAECLKDQQSYVYLPEVEAALAKIRSGE